MRRRGCKAKVEEAIGGGLWSEGSKEETKSEQGRGDVVGGVRKRRGKKEPPLRTVDEGLYGAVALGQNSR